MVAVFLVRVLVRVLVMRLVSPSSGLRVELLCSGFLSNGGRVVAFRSYGGVVAIPVWEHQVSARLEGWGRGMSFAGERVVVSGPPDWVDVVGLGAWARGVFEQADALR